MSQTIEEYLVALGFKVDQPGLQKFNQSIEQVGKTVSKNVGGITGDLFKLQFALTSGMLAIGSAAVVAADKFATFSNDMRLGAMHSFMTVQAFTELNTALKTVGVSLQDATWDPESRARVLQVMADTHAMLTGMGPDAEKSAKGIRDMKFEFQRFGNELFFLSNSVVSDLFKKLGFGSGNLLQQMQHLNTWFIQNLPHISDVIATDLVPILKDLWETLQDIGLVAKDAFAIFQNVVGILSGDSSLEGTAVTFESVAKSIEHAVHFADDFVKAILHLEEAILHLDLSKLTGKDLEFLGGAALLTKTGRGLIGKGLGAAGGAAAEAGAGAAALPLAAVAGGAVAGYELYNHRDAVEAWNKRFLTSIGRLPGQNADGTGTLPPGLLEALVHQESGGHQTGKDGKTLTSSAGALGLTQLLPSTARDLGVNPNNADDNLRGGAKYLSQLLAHFHGNQAEALAAYNTGEHRVDKDMLRNHGKFKLDDFSSETQNYVRSIEGRMGNSVSNDGDITVNVHVATNAHPQQIADAVQSGIRQADRKRSAFGAVSTAGPFQ
jgi:hypothetical protein